MQEKYVRGLTERKSLSRCNIVENVDAKRQTAGAPVRATARTIKARRRKRA